MTTYPLWSSFVQASSLYKSGSLSESVNAVQDAVTRLPPANRDTLAFLLLHLIRVAETPVTKMPVHNLAKVREHVLFCISSLVFPSFLISSLRLVLPSYSASLLWCLPLMVPPCYGASLL